MLVLPLFAPRTACAGGGPENVFVVANARSWASLTIAHHFAALRQLPPINVLYVDWPYSTDKVDVELFRQKLLLPVLSAINQRGISPQIDYIVYSSDFPWSIDFKAMLRGQQAPPQFTPVGSITSLTYFATQVVPGDFRFVALDSNHYMRRADKDSSDNPSQAFRGWYGFDEAGKLVEGGGHSYVLSTMLGVTSNYGMSVEETISYLKRSVAADGTKPPGTIYFCKTGDVHRSGTREPAYPAALSELKKLGVRAEVVNGKLPVGKKDVAGLLTGTRNFDWKGSQSTILPGALCENFTSYGGIFSANDNQQRLTDFLRAGAAGSSGTVVEPFAIPQKFPDPFVQVHYARGYSLAEAFYQAVASPYQLIILGDPLCSPWARTPTVSVEGVSAGATLDGTVSLRPSGELDGKPLDRFELYANGVQVSHCAASGTLEFDTTQFPDGDAELRVVGIEPSSVESQGRVILPVKFNNHRRQIEFFCSVSGKATWKEPFKLTAKATDAVRIVFSEGMRTLGVVTGDHGEIEVKPEELGLGPIAIRARAFFSETGKDVVISQPVMLTVVPDAPLPPRKLRAGTKLAAGLQFKAENGPLVPVPLTNEGKWLEDTKIKQDEPFILAAIFEAPTTGLYQFEVKHVGPLALKVDGQSLYGAKQKEAFWHYIPVSLQKGFHQFELRSQGGQPAGLEIRFGNDGVIDLDGKQFRHPGK
ncbi:MAG TPA: hypothetical protein VHD36_17945 [Pirellulales bacterium]|nr:hypothetical protein [Pirellulales bacterium]